MKNISKLIILLSLFSLTFCERPNASEIPDVVKQGMDKKYPDAKEIHWGKEGEEYEAEFKLNGVEKEAHFDEKGNFIKEEY